MDPLAGYRNALAKGEIAEIKWRDTGEGAPVKEGDLFPLRHGGVECIRIHRRREGRDWWWIGRFNLIRGDGTKRYFLGKGLGFINDPDYTVPAGESEFSPPDAQGVSLFSVATEPPEPECIPPHSVEELPTTVAARARFEAARRQEEIRRQADQQANRLKVLQKRAEMRGFDAGEAIDEIEAVLDRLKAALEMAA